MSKNKKFTYVMITLECVSNFWHIKTKKIWIATLNYLRIAKNFNFFEISQIVNRHKRQQNQIL